MIRLAFSLIAVLVCGCADEPGMHGPDLETSRIETFELPENRPGEIDVLLVIDDTPAMSPHRPAVASLPAHLEQVFSTPHGALIDYRIAVTTTEGGGVLRGMVADRPDFDGSHAKNFDGSLADALRPLVDAAAARQGENRPIAAANAAATASAFARAHASLVLVTMAATDDVSPRAVDEYAAELNAARSAVVVSGIYARPAARLDAFHLEFARNLYAPLDGDLGAAVAVIGQLLRTTLGVRCFSEPADVDPFSPGRQYDCALTTVIGGVERQLPACANPAAEPCWRFVAAPQICATPQTVTLELPGFPAPYHPTIRGQCLVK